MNMENITFRYACEEDCGLILSLIKELAEYENLSDEVIADESLLSNSIFKEGSAEVIFPCVNGREIGFALFFHNYSTFLGRKGLYLEDLYIKQEFRGRGYGKATLKKLAQIACERGCGRLEWSCLDSNRPAVDFYLSLGARPMDEWTVYRLTGDTLKNLAE